MDNERFKRYCAIRALANAVSCERLAAIDFINRDDFGGFRKLLTESGAVWNRCKAIKGKSRMTVKEFAETHKTGRFVIEVASHFTACVDGVILGGWNCGEKCVVGYFDMAGFDINR